MAMLSQTVTKNRRQEAHASLRVVHVVLSMDCGGLERLVLSLVCEARERNQAVSVLCLEQPGALAPRVKASGTQLVCVHKCPGLRLTTVGRIKAALRELRPDVVHTHQ